MKHHGFAGLTVFSLRDGYGLHYARRHLECGIFDFENLRARLITSRRRHLGLGPAAGYGLVMQPGSQVHRAFLAMTLYLAWRGLRGHFLDCRKQISKGAADAYLCVGAVSKRYIGRWSASFFDS